MAGYTYTSYRVALAELLVVDTATLNNILPTIIDYAEGRCYRDLDLIDTNARDATSSTSANTRTFTLPAPATDAYFTVVDGINIIQSSSRTPVTPTTQAFIDLCWPTATAASATTIPQYYAMVTETTLIWGPPPGGIFTVEVVGKTRPAPLSSTNTTTILSTYYPELFVAASMVFGSGWQKNFGSSSDDPRQALSWEATYARLLPGATSENARARGSRVTQPAAQAG